MSNYQTVLVAVDLTDESAGIVEAARAVCPDGACLHLIHVQEPMDSLYMGVVPYGPAFTGMDAVEGELRQELKSRLRALGEAHEIPADRCHFVNGAPAREIHRFAEKHDVDLVVLGTHGRKGVQLLLGSTANAVLHGAKCDVLAVRCGPGE